MSEEQFKVDEGQARREWAMRKGELAYHGSALLPDRCSICLLLTILDAERRAHAATRETLKRIAVSALALSAHDHAADAREGLDACVELYMLDEELAAVGLPVAD